MAPRRLLALAVLAGLMPASPVRGADVTKLRVVLKLPGTEKTVVRRDLRFSTRAGEPKRFDLYLPVSAAGGEPHPVVVFVNGIDPALLKDGPELKEWGQYQDWPRLAAASGMAAVTHTSGADPAAVLEDLLGHLRKNAADLSIDASRIALWACSGNGHAAVPYAMGEGGAGLKAAVFYYSEMEAATLRRDLPLLVVRAGRDAASLNKEIDRFVARALGENVPLRLVNYAEGEHGFDVKNDSPESRRIIAETLEFLRDRLGVGQAGK